MSRNIIVRVGTVCVSTGASAEVEAAMPPVTTIAAAIELATEQRALLDMDGPPAPTV
jgi:hypothetical protein